MSDFLLGVDGEVCVSVDYLDHQLGTELCTSELSVTFPPQIPGNVRMIHRIVNLAMETVFQHPPIDFLRELAPRISWMTPLDSAMLYGNKVRFAFHVDGVTLSPDLHICIREATHRVIVVCSAVSVFEYPLQSGVYTMVPFLYDTRSTSEVPHVTTSPISFKILGGNEGGPVFSFPFRCSIDWTQRRVSQGEWSDLPPRPL